MRYLLLLLICSRHVCVSISARAMDVPAERTVRFSLGALLLLAMLSSAGASKPLPPPPTLDQTVHGADLILVATGSELIPMGRDGRTVSDLARARAEAEPIIGYYLKARVERVLFCKGPCVSRSEVIILMPPFPADMSVAQALFVGREHIFLVMQTHWAAGIAAEFSDSWLARNIFSEGFFLPVEREADVASAIAKHKTGANAENLMADSHNAFLLGLVPSFTPGSIVYYDFMPAGFALPSATELQPNTTVTAFTAAQEQAARQIFDMLETFANITFRPTNATHPTADIRFGAAGLVGDSGLWLPTGATSGYALLASTSTAARDASLGALGYATLIIAPQFSDSWLARNMHSQGFFLSVSREPEVASAIQKYKASTSAEPLNGRANG
jgi:hypothetical protein